MSTTPLQYVDVEGVSIKADRVIKVQELITTFLQKPSTRDAIKSDILRFSGIMISIEQGFGAVTSQISLLDDGDLVTRKFKPDWESLLKEYKVLKSQSVRHANDIRDKIETFIRVTVPVLQEVGVSLNEKQGILKEYIESLKDFRAKAEGNGGRFQDLGSKVATFRDRLRNEVGSEKKTVDQKFEEIEKQLKQLESLLKKLSDETENSWWKFWQPGGKTEIAGITTLAEIAPTIGKEMMNIALDYLDSDVADELKNLEQKVKDDLKNLQLMLGDDSKSPRQALGAALTKDVFSSLKSLCQRRRIQIAAKFTKVFDDLNDLEPTFTGMSVKISKIQGIWQLLAADSQTLMNKLSEMEGTKYNSYFQQHVKTLEATYEALHFSLDQYALAVREQPEVDFGTRGSEIPL